jgi:transposase
VLAANERKQQLTERIAGLLPEWSLKPLVEALRGLRGIDLISATTFVAAVGDMRRFETPRHLMDYLGLVPSEHSSGDTRKKGGITKTGNREARRMLIEASWCYRYPARVARDKMKKVIELPKPVRDISWKAQLRLCERFRRLSMKGKKSTVVAAAIARELCGFIWAIGQQVEPAMA